MSRHDRIGRGVLVALGVAYAALGLVVSLRAFPIGDLDVEADFFAELGPAAQHIAHGDWSVANHPFKGPLEPVLVALLHAALGWLHVGWYRCAVALSIASVLLTFVAVYRLGRALAGMRVAAAAMLLVAGCYLVFVQGHKASSDALFMGLVALTLAVVLDRDPVRARRWLLAGLLCGAAFLTRYIGAAVPVWVIGVALLRPHGGAARRRLGAAALVTLGFLVLAGPWFALNLHQTGSLLATSNRMNVAREYAGTSGLGGVVAHYVSNLPGHLGLFAHHVLTWPVAAAALLAVIVALASRPGWRLCALIAWAAVYLAALAVVFFLPRFGLPLVPVTSVLIALLLVGDVPPGAPVVVQRFLACRRVAGYAAGWLAVAVLVIMPIRSTIEGVAFYRSQQPLHLQGAIAFLQQTSREWTLATRPVLMARKAHAAFLGDMDWRPYPTRRFAAPAFLRSAAERGVDFILVGPIERDYADAAFDLTRLGKLTGVRSVYADTANVIYRLDRTADLDSLGRDRDAATSRATLASCRASGDAAGAFAASRDLAFALSQDGELAEAQSILQAAIATASRDFADDPAQRGALRVARVNLAWICLLTEDHAAGVAALGPYIEDYGQQPDRALEARACEYLGIHEAGLGLTTAARSLLDRAAALYGSVQRAPDQRRVLQLGAQLGH